MTEHFCEKHQVAFDRHEKEGKVWYSHKDGEKWCNEKEEKKPKEVKPEPTNGKHYGKTVEELELSRRSFALSYAKDLCVAGKIPIGEILDNALIFEDYLTDGQARYIEFGTPKPQILKFETEMPEEKPTPIDSQIDWLRENLPKAKWSDATLTSWINAQFKISAKHWRTGFQQITDEQRKQIIAKIQDLLGGN